MNWMPITYGDFYDLPRLILLTKGKTQLLLDCAFDEVRDDYDDDFSVYVLNLPQKSVPWSDIRKYIVRKIGVIPVKAVQFDETRRQRIASRELDEMLASLAEDSCDRGQHRPSSWRWHSGQTNQ